MKEMKVDNLKKAGEAIAIAEILLQNDWTVTLTKYKPNEKTNTYRYSVVAEHK